MSVNDPLEAAAGPVRQQLLERLLARRPAAPGAAEAAQRVPPGQAVPLSPLQAPMWFLCRLYPHSAEYNTYGALAFERSLGDQELRAALQAVVDRHDALRLRVFARDELPYQALCENLPLPLRWHDFQGLDEAQAKAQAQAAGNRSVATPLSLDEAPLFRVEAMRLPRGRTLLLVVIHHIVSDGWSMGIVLDELNRLLGGHGLPPAPALRFIDDVARQHGPAHRQRQDAQLAYWRRQLAGELPVLDLPKDRPRPPQPSRRGHIVPCVLPPALVQRAKALAQAQGTTLFVVLLAAYKALLWRLTGQTDLIVGVPFAGRDRTALESVVGCFVNSLALRTQLEDSRSFLEVLRRVQRTQAEAQDHQSVPFERVVSELRVPRELQYNPVFQTMFALQNTPGDFLEGQVGTLAEWCFDSGTAKFDLVFSLFDTPDGVDGFAEYAADLFDAATVQRLVAMYHRLLDAMLTDPARPVQRHALVSPDERQHILHGLNAYRKPQLPYHTMAQPFEEQVRRTPDAVALVGDEGRWTYRELNERANRLAHHLRSLGIGRGDFVGMCMERSFALLVALYAVAKSGAAYVPLDPELPDGRIAFMLEDTAPRLVFVDAATHARVAAHAGGRPLLDPAHDSAWSACPAADLPCDGPAHHLVHLLYTSGSTGRPKAVAYPVDGALADIFWLQQAYPFAPGDANLFKTSYGFDVSIWEIFWPLYVGAKLVVCRPGGHRDPRYLIEQIDRHRVNLVFLIPSLMQAVLEELRSGECAALRWVICGGEPMTPRLRDSFHARMSATLVNGYGPTEAGCVTDMVVPREPGVPVVPLGRPAANFRLYVLDEDLDVMSIGVPGEAYIGGDVGLAHAYHGRPALTAERFLPDPFGTPGSRMYRTGDVCRYRPDGVLEHLGRLGTQVKIRGMRVELAEIEAVLCEDPAVAACVASAVSDAAAQKVVAFVVPAEGAALDPAALLASAARFLPSYMVPSDVVLLERIPTSLNGKIDRLQMTTLWRAGGSAVPREIVPPADDGEARLKQVFESVLECGEVGVTESFFDLGGHSLLVFKLVAACEAEFGHRPPVVDIFSAPTVRSLWPRIRAAEAVAHPCLVPLAPAPGKPVLAFIHAASGSVLPFMALARQLADEYAVYGLQAAGMDREQAGPLPIERMAADYLAALESVRGPRPLVLAGWSMGGCVAMEIARLLRQRGDEAAALLLLDTWLPPALRASAQAAAQARQAILELDVLALEGVDPQGVEPDALRHVQRVIDDNRLSFLDHAPARYEGVVDYLRACEDVAAPLLSVDGTHLQPERGWRAHVRELAIHTVAGNHFTLLARENVPALAETVRAIVASRLSFAVI
jgi:amino acid adenylation domain-containing protein